jgi:CsoR family transcriptional regulator, copper-sensing transcriptional repressor
MPKGIPRNKSTQSDLLKRYKIARGHLKKVITMLEDGRYCLDVVHQSIAVQAALKKADRALLENHLKTCVEDQIKKGQAQESISEIMGVLRKI